jgi:indolepyruvate decarboxylase
LADAQQIGESLVAFNISDYIIERLKQQGVDILFGVPSVYCASLYFAAENATNFSAIVTSSDLEAGYAADGYARVRGLSSVAVSYGPGTLSLANAIVGAYVERSPIVVINGGPSDKNIRDQTTTGVLYSHSMGRPHTDMEVFQPLTAFCERVTDATLIPGKVDQAIRTAITRKHPVYLEIPQAMLGAKTSRPTTPLDLSIPPGAAAKTANAILKAINAAKAPVLIIGIEVQRYGLAAGMLSIINKLKIRWATTLLARTTLSEQHPQFLGVFNGEKAPQPLKAAVSGADLIISLGAVFGSGHATIMIPQTKKTIRVWDGNVVTFNGAPEQLSFPELIAQLDRNAVVEEDRQLPALPPYEIHELGEAAWDGDRDAELPSMQKPRSPTTAAATGMSYDALFQVIEQSVTPDPALITIADTFLGIYPSARIRMPVQNSFLASAIWASIGHSVAAAVGVAAARGKRPVVICGDGGFQMTVQSLSTMARSNLNAIVLIVDNGLYGYEQYLLDSTYYSGTSAPLSISVIDRWDYVGVARSLGVSQLAAVDTAAALTAAIAAAKAQNGPAVIQAIVQSRSLPSGL